MQNCFQPFSYLIGTKRKREKKEERETKLNWRQKKGERKGFAS
jgi:hypothetical protein